MNRTEHHQIKNQLAALSARLQRLNHSLSEEPSAEETTVACNPRLLKELSDELMELSGSLQASDNLYYRLREGDMAVVCCDREGEVVAANHAFEQLSLLKEDAIKGYAFKQLFEVGASQTPDFSQDFFIYKAKLKGPFQQPYVSVRGMKDQELTVLLIENITSYVLAAEKYTRDDQELKEFFSQSSDFIIVFDEQGNILFANDSCSSGLGIMEGDMLEQNLFELLLEKDKGTFEKLLERVVETNQSSFLDIRMKGKDKVFSLRGHVACKKSYNMKQPNVFRMFLVDMTDKLMTEEAMDRSKSRLEAMFESGEQLKWVINPHGRFVKVNHKFQQYMLSLGTLINKNDFVYHLKNIRRPQINFWERRYVKAFKGENLKFEWSTRNADGSEKWLEVQLSPVRYKDDSIREVYAVATDVTERKVLETKLKESEGVFRTIFQSLKDVVYFKADMEGNILMISPSIYEMLGVTEEDALSKKLTDFYLDKKSLKEEVYPELKKNKIVKDSLHPVRNKVTGEEKYISLTFWLSKTENDNWEIQGVAKDVTEWKKLKDSLEDERNKAIDVNEVRRLFLSKMSHEMRTPLNGIMGELQLLQDTHLQLEQVKHMETIMTTTMTLQQIIDDILDLSKIEAEMMDLNLRPVNLMYTMDKIHEVNVTAARAKGVEFKITFNRQPTEIFMIDELRFIQILNNLVSNAIKYTPEGEVHVQVICSPKFTNSRRWVFYVSVKDTGVGISEADMEKLFDPYTRVNHPYSKTLKGTGLGLPIARELAVLMGGELGVDSVEGEGSTFWFSIEADTTTQEETNKPSKIGNVFTHCFVEAPKLLFVDDFKTNRHIGRSILLKLGCEVDEAADGQQAVEKALSKDYDLIFMDIQMPVMNGLEATAKIHEVRPDWKIPIIALTAFTMEEEIQEFLDAGLDDVLPKPIDTPRMVECLLEHLNRGEKQFEMKEREASVIVDVPKPVKKSYALNKDLLGEDGSVVIQISFPQQLSKYGGEELIAMSYEEFCQDIEVLFQHIEKGLEEEDLEGIRGDMHTIKGAAAQLGIVKLSEKARIGEQKLKAENASDLREDFLAIRRAFEEFKQVLEEWK
ncbi:PAS domain S-box protein [Algivirga pacifica]|uniref:histidine kinase n=1 Tax=Algivirga pacifica TaxID=1162670 RepID=A0ABP9DKS1_9BACT